MANKNRSLEVRLPALGCEIPRGFEGGVRGGQGLEEERLQRCMMPYSPPSEGAIFSRGTDLRSLEMRQPYLNGLAPASLSAGEKGRRGRGVFSFLHQKSAVLELMGSTWTNAMHYGSCSPRERIG